MIAVLFARMYALNGYDPRMQPDRILPSQMQGVCLQPIRMEPVQMQAVRMQPAQMQPTQMQAARMQPARMQPAHMQAAQMQAVRLQQAGQLYGLNNVPTSRSSRSTTTANVLSRSSEGKGFQPGIPKRSLIPLLPGPGKLVDTVALHEKVDRECEVGWKFDTRAWSRRPDPLLNYLYGFTREEYVFLKHQKMLNTDPLWEIDRIELDQLKALRPWYHNEGTDDSDLVLLSDAALSKELDAFYGGMGNVKISDVKVSGPINGDRDFAAGIASNLPGTKGKSALNNFVEEAHVGSEDSAIPMKLGPRGCFIDSGVCMGEHGSKEDKVALRKTATSSNHCYEGSGTDRAPDDEDELTSVVNAPYDLEGFTPDPYHDTACDLQLGPWQASIGELTKENLPKMPDCPPSSSARLDGVTSLLGLEKSATSESPNTLSVDGAVRKPSLMGRSYPSKRPACPLNSASSESSLPSSPETLTPQESYLWNKRLINAGLAPHIELRYQLKRKPQPGDAKYALLEQMSEMRVEPNDSSGYLGYRASSTTDKNRKTAEKRRANDEDADSDDTIKAQDAEACGTSHKPLKKKLKKVEEMKAGGPA